MQTCPLCGSDAEISAAACGCGYRFSGSRGSVEATSEQIAVRPSEASWMLPVGVGFALIGFIGSVFAFMMDVSLGDSGYANIDAVGMRTMYFVSAAATTLVGVIMSCTGVVINCVKTQK